MGYGHLTSAQEALLAPFVSGREVWDLGSGDGSWARFLLKLGASSIVAVDKAPLTKEAVHIHVITALFQDIPPGPIDVAFLSWPSNNNLPGLIELLERARTVIYLGHNFEGTACGNVRLFQHLCGRKLLAYGPDRRNSLVVVGESLEDYRVPTPEERAGLSSEICSWPEHFSA